MSFGILFMTIGLANGLPPGMLESICYIETTHKADKIHYHDGKSNSYGICQIKESTARLMGFKGRVEDLLDAKVNITYAAKYLRYQLDRYNGNYARAITAYNKGSSTGHGGSEYFSKVINYWIANQGLAGRPLYARGSS